MSIETFPFDDFFKVNKTEENQTLRKEAPLEIKNDIQNDSDLVLFGQEILNQLKNIISPQNYNTFFEHTLEVQHLDSSILILSCKTNFIKNMIEQKYLKELNQAIENTLGKAIKVEIKVAEKPLNNDHSNQSKPVNVKDFTFNISELSHDEFDKKTIIESKVIQHDKVPNSPSINIDSKKNFDNFIVGASNNFAHAASLSVAKNPGKAYPSLYIHGNSGLGKTHLLHAVANYIRNEKPATKIHFTSANAFMTEIIEAIKENKITDFRKKYSETIDLLIVDDVHELKNKEGTQREFFHVFNELTNKKKQLIFTSDKHPKEIYGLEDRIRTRLSGGMVVEIQQPDFETRIAILKSKAQEEDIYLPEDVINLVAKSVKNSVRELEGSLINLGAYSSIYNVDIDLEVAKKQLRINEEDQYRIHSLDSIAKIISEHFKIPLSDMKSQARKKDITYARHIAMFLSHKHIKTTTTKIAEFYGRKDHTTVVHAIQKIKSSFKNCEKTNHDLIKLESIL
jgi:chromosomal replication initiator protein